MEQSKVPVNQQRLFYKGKLLQDDSLVETIQDGATLMMAKGAVEKKESESTDSAPAEAKEEEKEVVPVQCAGGCGFWGNPKTENLCSKCFGEKQKKDEAELRKKTERIKETKKEEKKKQDEDAAVAATAPAATGGEETTASASSDAASGEQAEKTEGEKQESEANAEPIAVERPVQEKKTRCWICNKKVGLAGFECRCGYIFCAQHRYAEQHNCDFDFKTTGRDQLRKQNLKVVADKLDKA